MRKIQKTISLEPMTSRMPSIWPAYKDNKLYFFDDVSLKKRGYLYPSNYGMIPMQISYSSTTNGYKLSCDSGATILSFENLSKWYHFFKEYYHLLNDYGHCNRVYSSATEYYKYESGNRYADQMIYGTDEQTYIDLDVEFEERGGHVDVASISSGATDIGFYKWICDNVVPSYYISSEYADYWKRKKLYYPDVIKWLAWLGARLNYENDAHYSPATDIEVAHWNCKQENIDCCDCDEYFNRGGEREYERMKSWYNNVQKTISGNNKTISACYSAFTPSMIGEIELQNSIEDLGGFSIFSSEYELGIDYRTVKTVSANTETIIHYESGNTNSGTVVTYNGDAMILQPNSSGFCYSPYYMEKIYDENAWSSYTEVYINEHKDEFVSSSFTYYAYDEYGRLYTTTEVEYEKALSALSGSMSAITECQIISGDSILIDDTLFPIQRSEFGTYNSGNTYLSGKTFFVYREKETSTPYTLINGKKIYAELYTQDNPPFYYFTFFSGGTSNLKENKCGVNTREKNVKAYKRFPRIYNGSGVKDDDTIRYIVYESVIYNVADSGVTINGVDYPYINGYAFNADNDIMYISGNAVYDSDFIDVVPNAQIDESKNAVVIGIEKVPTIYNAKEITGKTISKLSDLALTNTLIDDVGNKIDGRYNPNKEEIYNHQPPQGTELDLLYEVGNTSNIGRISGITSADTSIETNYFIGNIITDMVFYYKDIYGEEVSATTVGVHFKKGDDYSIEVKSKKDGYINVTVPSGSTSLSAITASTSARTDIENNVYSDVIFDGEDIYCDITYYVGATLERKNNQYFKLAYSADVTTNNYNYGIEYKETVKFVKENREYYLKIQTKRQIPKNMKSVSAHSISYPIYVYNLTQEMAEINTDTYNTLYTAPLATFKTEINLIDSGLTTNYSGYTDMDAFNGIHVYPTFRQEYMLGNSSMEKIDSDIYIERGINAAFEKHLKLGEVRTMEALLQYGNSYFKIMNN